MWRHNRTARTIGWAAVILASAATAFLIYQPTLDYGFYYDDYHFVRPYPAAEVRAAFRGPWDASGIELPFYRPLTVAFYAARFEWLGIDAHAHHLLSLVMFTAAGALVGLTAWCFTGRGGAATAAALTFVSHPAMPYALVVWATNQMHLLGTLIAVGALVWWHACRARTVAWWLPLLAAAAATFLVKEDGIMLLPAVLALHALRRRMLEPALPPAPRAFVAASVLLMAALVAVRSVALQEATGGYGLPDAPRAWSNFWVGLDRVLRLVPADRPWQPLAGWFATLLPLAALIARDRATAPARYCMAAGATIALFFNLPFLMVTKGEQMHMVATGAVLLLTGSALALWDAAGSRPARALITAATAAGLLAFATVARDISTDFEPFGANVLAKDRIVSQWAAVPDELRHYLDEKRQEGASARVPANPARAVAMVAFGLHPWETSPDGHRYRWMSGNRTTVVVRASAREVIIPLRHEAGAFGGPASVQVTLDGRPADALLLRDGGWTASRIPLGQSRRSDARRMHRVVISIERAWVPARVIPGSTDTRTLGLQIGELQVR